MLENKITLGFSSNPIYSGNVKALYEQIEKRKLNNYELIWFVKNNGQKEALSKINIKAISEDEENFEEELKKVEIMFITHDQYIEKKKEYQTFISLWHGIGPKKIGYALDDCYEKRIC